jgi:hypothetical protein
MTTPTTVRRTNDTVGDDFRTFDDGGAIKSQAVGLIDDAGAHSGIETNPAKTREPEPTNRYDSTVLENSAQAKGSAGVLREVTAVLDSTVIVSRYLHVFDSIIALAGGETPVFRFPIPAGGAVNVHFPGGRSLSTGVQVGISTTLVTYTAPGGAEGVFHVEMD